MVRLGPGSVGREVRAVFTTGPVAGLSDAELVHRFVARRDPASFEALVQRHGGMVRGVCRSLLGDEHAADDAFQAVFLVLMRRAGSVRVGDSLGRWLHGVALRVARHARAEMVRRRRREGADPSGVDPIAAGHSTDAAAHHAEALALLHEELGRLPAAFRAPLVLCHLEGLTHEQAAATLDCPVGTVRSRLARGRDRLRDRLVRRGLAPAAALAAVDAATAQAGAAVPATLASAAFAVAARHATGRLVVGTAGAGLGAGVGVGVGAGGTATTAAAAIVSPSVITLTKGALVAMTFGTFKVAGLGVLGTLVLTLGAAAVAQRAGEGPAVAVPGAAGAVHAGPRESLLHELDQLARRQVELNERITVVTRQLAQFPRGETPDDFLPIPDRAGPSIQSLGADLDRLVLERDRAAAQEARFHRLARNPDDPALVRVREQKGQLDAKVAALGEQLAQLLRARAVAAVPPPSAVDVPARPAADGQGNPARAESIGAEIDRLVAERARRDEHRREVERVAKNPNDPALIAARKDLARIEARLVELVTKLGEQTTIAKWTVFSAKPDEVPALTATSPATPPSSAAAVAARPSAPALAALPSVSPPAAVSIPAGSRVDPAADPFARNEAQALLAGYRLAKGNVGRTALLREKGVISSAELDKVVGEKDVALARVLDQLRRARDEVAVLGVQKRRQEAEISRARAQAELAGTQTARNARLNDKIKGSVAPEEIAKAEAEVKVAQAALQMAEADLELVMVRLQQAQERVALLETALKEEQATEPAKR